jgi:hypothetical protein
MTCENEDAFNLFRKDDDVGTRNELVARLKNTAAEID